MVIFILCIRVCCYQVHGHCGQVVPTCETACYSDAQCIGASQCTCCTGGVCELPLFPQSCISDADGLSKAALGSSNQITLCLNSKITLSSTIHLDRFGQDITLSCIGSCSIVGTNTFPLMVINANTVKITGIEFTGGKSYDNVRVNRSLCFRNSQSNNSLILRIFLFSCFFSFR
jgi:hypothetical protein